jgi:hypothetical protein
MSIHDVPQVAVQKSNMRAAVGLLSGLIFVVFATLLALAGVEVRGARCIPGAGSRAFADRLLGMQIFTGMNSPQCPPGFIPF